MQTNQEVHAPALMIYTAGFGLKKTCAPRQEELNCTTVVHADDSSRALPLQPLMVVSSSFIESRHSGSSVDHHSGSGRSD